MAEPEIAGAGAVLLAAYFGIEQPTLSKVFRPISLLLPTLSSATLWHIVTLLEEEGKCAAEVSNITSIDVVVIELIKSCIEIVKGESRK